MHHFGLIGFGSIAEHGHLPALQSFPQIAVTAVADPSPARLDRARELLPHARLYLSPEEMIARADINAVDICSPPSTHADLLVRACHRGLETIVCEKPFVLREEEYERVARARAESGSRLISVNNWRHSDLDRHVRAALWEGSIGPVRSIVLRTGRPAVAQGNAGWQPQWRTDPRHAGGGIILDHGWHLLYLILGWMNQPLEFVSAITRTGDPRHSPVEDEATIDLLFTEGQGRIELAWTAGERCNDGCVQGTDGRIEVHDDRVVVHARAGARTFPFEGRLTQSSYHPEWFQKMFAGTILDQETDEADRNFAEAGILVGAINAAYRSAEQHGTPCRPIVPSIDSAAETRTTHVGGRSTDTSA